MKFDRAFSLARYNWPLYVVCFFGAVIGFLLWVTPIAPAPVKYVGLVGAIVATWYAVASFLAFQVMFDRPDFLSGEWLSSCVTQSPKTCVQLSVCVDETTLPISKVFPNAQYVELDLFDDSVMTEPAIARAKQEAGGSASIVAKPDALPLSDDVSELTVVTLAAHEVRDAHKRKSLFLELSRITASNGQLIVAEHLRNIPALLAFGPGLFHFYPRATWVTLAKESQFKIESEFDITPFFHVFVLRHA